MFAGFPTHVRDAVLALSAALCLSVPTEAQSQAFAEVTAGEYVWDVDPGAGAGSPIGLSESSIVAGALGVNVPSLPAGIHRLGVRARDSFGQWSELTWHPIQVQDSASASLAAPSLDENKWVIVRAEYFWDTDPGIGLGISTDVVDGEVVSSGYPGDFYFQAGVSSLSSGIHRLGARFQDGSGRWSSVEWHPLVVHDAATLAAVPDAQLDDRNRLLTAAEYFWDSDPGFGLGTSVNIAADEIFTAGWPANSSFQANVSGLGPGIHRLGFRARDGAGQWSATEWMPLQIQDVPTLAGPGAPDFRDESRLFATAEYFWDVDPGEGNAVATSIPSAMAIDFGMPGTNSLIVDYAPVTAGVHRLGFRVKDASGKWSAAEFAPIDIPGHPLAKFNGIYYGSNVVPATNGAQFQVTLESRYGAGGIIFYTTDGSDPRNFEHPYLGPFTITAPFKLRAVAFSDDFLSETEALPIHTLELLVPGGGTVAVQSQVDQASGLTTTALQATPSQGWSFMRWEGDAAGVSTNVSILMDRPRSVSAIFGSQLNVAAPTGGAVLREPNLPTYPFGARVQLSAVPNAGYYFRFWGGALLGQYVSPITISVTNISTYSAVFSTLPVNSYGLTTLIEGAGTVTRSPQQSNFLSGASVTLTAVAASGNHFVGWFGDASGVTNTLTISMNSSKVITAKFESDLAPNPPPTVTLLAPVTTNEFRFPTNILMVADATDDKAVVRVDFFANGSLLGSSTGSDITNRYSFVWTNAPVGTNTIIAQAVDNQNASASTPARQIVVLPPEATTFRWAQSQYDTVENAGQIALTILKSGVEGGSVNYVIRGRSAELGRDYSGSGGSVTFQPNESSKTVQVTLLNEFIPDGSKQLEVELISSGSVPLRDPTLAVVTISDDDASLEHNSFLEFGIPNPRPFPRGSLQMFLEPAQASGQWRFPWELFWRNTADVAGDLDPSAYAIEFRPRINFTTPPSITETIPGGVAVIRTNNYTSARTVAGSVRALVGPVDLLPVPPGWRFLGETAFHTNNELVANVPPGRHLIEFKSITGWVQPAPREVFVQADVESFINLSYTTFVEPGLGISTPLPLQSYSIIESGYSSAPRQPYPVVGQLHSLAGYGSGVAVRDRVVLTAAHVLFDESTLDYVSKVEWFGARYAGQYEPRPISAAGWYVNTNYLSERRRERNELGLAPGVSSPASQQWDVAAIYFNEPVIRGGFSGYLLSDLDNNEWLLGSLNKELLGYPIKGAITDGQMQFILGANYTFRRDSGRIFSSADFQSYPGSSGGPLCVSYNRGDGLVYFPAAVYLGNYNSRSIVRAIDSDIASLINRAASSAALGTNFTSGGPILIGSGGLGPLKTTTLTVNITPPTGSWRTVGSTAYLNSGASATLPIGPAQIEFKPLAGYVTPSLKEITLVADQAARVSVNYTAPDAGQFTRFQIIAGKLHVAIRRAVTGSVDVETCNDLTAPQWNKVQTINLTAGVEVETDINPVGGRIFVRLKSAQ